MQKSKNIDEIVKQYKEKVHPLCEGFAKKLADLLGDLLRNTGIEILPIECRAKTVESFSKKQGLKEYRDPLVDMKDLCGVRIITYYLDDVDRITSLVREEFLIDDEKSLDKFDELGADEFGYRSIHLIISLNDKRRSLTEWQQYRDLCAEIQIRSVLQHSWASISHKLDYKRVSEAPKQLRRKLFRLSALFELADEEFVSIRESSEEIVKGYKADLDSGTLDIPLDLDSLRAFLKEKVDLDHWVALSKKVGFNSPYPEDFVDEDTEPFQRLLTILLVTGVRTLRELELILSLPDERITKNLRLFYKQFPSDEKTRIWLHTADVFTTVVAIERFREIPKSFGWGGFGQEAVDAVKKIFRSLNKSESGKNQH